jgi:hypothetical protein
VLLNSGRHLVQGGVVVADVGDLDSFSVCCLSSDGTVQLQTANMSARARVRMHRKSPTPLSPITRVDGGMANDRPTSGASASACDGHHEMSDLGAVGEPLHRCDHLFSEITCASRKREQHDQQRGTAWLRPGGATAEDHEQDYHAQFRRRREVREPRAELSEAELNTLSGGKVMHGDLQVQKYLDKAST